MTTTLEKTAVRVFDHVVVRAAAAPFHQLDALRAEESLRRIRALREEQQAIDAEKAAVLDALYGMIGAETDPANRRVLVDVRRQLFHGKRPRTAIACVSALLDRMAAFDEAERAAASAFDAEVARLRKRLAELASQPIVQRGLALSSRNLRASFNNFYRKRVAGTLNSKDLDVEQGIVKYVSRIAVKPSPFSTFTNLACGRLSDGQGTLGETSVLSAESPRVVSRIHLNHLVLRFLRRALLADAELRRAMPLSVNATLARIDGQYRFFTNANNVEVFQRLAIHPLIDVILESVAAGAPSYAAAVDALLQTGMLDMSRDEVFALFDELLAFGILEYDVPPSGLDFDWAQTLRRLLDGRDNPAARAIVAALDELITIAGEFGNADADTREALLARGAAALEFATDRSRSMLVSFGEDGSFRRDDAVFTQPPPHLLYEDSLLDCEPLVSRRAIEPIAIALETYMRHIDRFDTFALNRQHARRILVERHGAGATVDLLPFFEELCRVKHAEKEKLTLDPRWIEEMIRRARVHGDAADLAEADLAAMTELVPPTLPRPHSDSQGAFVQLFRDRGALRAVVNGYSPGFGKGVSRLLHFYDDCTRALRDENARIDPDAMLATATDSSCWNSNLHPPVMPYSIRIPGGEKAVAVTEISIADLCVRDADGDLALIHRPSGRRVYVFDLGLQAISERSDLYQFLTRMTLTTFSPAMMLPELLAARSGRLVDEHVTVQPRVIYDGFLVLRRRNWTVSRDAVPRRARGESAWTHLRRIDEWRMRYAIPDRVFVTARPRTEAKSGIQEASRDDRKPQYIDFANPFLVQVLDNLLGRAVERIQFVEMLPSPDDLLTIGGHGHAAELVLQWYAGDAYGR